MIGLDQDGHAGGALVEAAGRARACSDFRQTPFEERDLESLVNGLRALRRARSLGVVVGSTVRANEEVPLSLRHRAEG